MMPVNTSVNYVLAALHALVRERSSVPKVAEKIGMNYYALRDNLLGNTEIRLKTYYAILDALDVSETTVRERALLLEKEHQAGQ